MGKKTSLVFPTRGFLHEYFDKEEPSWKDYFETTGANPIRGFLSKEDAEEWAESLSIHPDVSYDIDSGEWVVRYKENPRIIRGMSVKVPHDRVKGWYMRYAAVVEDSKDIVPEFFGYLPEGVYYVIDMNPRLVLLAGDAEGFPSTKHRYFVPKSKVGTLKVRSNPETKPVFKISLEKSRTAEGEEGVGLLVAKGDTYPVRDLLKRWGFWWRKDSKVWVKTTPSLRVARNTIERMREDFEIDEVETDLWQLTTKTPADLTGKWIVEVRQGYPQDRQLSEYIFDDENEANAAYEVLTQDLKSEGLKYQYIKPPRRINGV